MGWSAIYEWLEGMGDVLHKRLSHTSLTSGRGASTKGFGERMPEVRSRTSWVMAGRAGAVWLLRCGCCGFINLLLVYGLGDLTVKQRLCVGVSLAMCPPVY